MWCVAEKIVPEEHANYGLRTNAMRTVPVDMVSMVVVEWSGTPV